ncbi:hypothetical protein MTYM_00330 [Methylococcales bacterium]|nr:hypothetical protein MTYM_00330 [Methylococcales bacterium]
MKRFYLFGKNVAPIPCGLLLVGISTPYPPASGGQYPHYTFRLVRIRRGNVPFFIP